MQMWNCHEETYAYRFLESGGMAHHAGTHKDTPGQVKRQRELGDSVGKSLLWFPQEGWVYKARTLSRFKVG